MTKKRWIATVVAICMVVLLFQYIPVLHASAATEGSIKSGVTGVYFRETPGGTPIKDSNGNTIYLNGGQALTIQDTSNSSWYKVTLTYNGGSYTGYVSSQYVVAGAAPTPSTPSGDADFEAKLSAQGFPDSYKPYLRAIHEKYPNWEFRAVQTGVDWNTLVANEVSKSGQVKNLIYGTSSYPHYNWRSTTIGYNIATDTWSSFDGKTWFAASDELVAAAGYLADRISVNMELPTEEGLRTLAPNKTMQTILDPMGKVRNTIASHRMAIGKSAHMERSKGNQFLKQSIFGTESKKQFADGLMKEKKAGKIVADGAVVQESRSSYGNKAEEENYGAGSGGSVTGETDVQNTIANLAAKMNGTVLDSALTWDNAYQLAPLDMSKLKRRFAPAGQSTQMIIGATGESDYTLLQTTQQLYQGFDLKRVFYSAYIPLNEDKVLPQIGTPPPLLREHRLYQADWLLRFYGFQAGELLSEEKPNFNELVDPKCDWALRHLDQFPVEVQTASYAMLLRVPGIGPKSAGRIAYARRYGRLDFASLKKMGVVLKRAQYFIICGGRQMYHTPIEEGYITRQLTGVDQKDIWKAEHANESFTQMSLADFGIG